MSMNRMNGWQFAVLVVVHVLLSIGVVFKGCEAIKEGYPVWAVLIITSAWFIFSFEMDRYVWEHDIRKRIARG
jgi:hypothetical protein